MEYVSQVFSLGLLVIGSNTSVKQSKIINVHPVWVSVLQPSQLCNEGSSEMAKSSSSAQ